MRRTSIGSGELSAKTRMNIEFALLIGMFAVGMIYGVLFVRSGLEFKLSFLTNEYSRLISVSSVWVSFKNTLFSNLAFLLLPYLLGFSAVGQPFVLSLPFFKGLGLGFFTAQMYTSYGIGGIGFCALIILPYSLAVVFCDIIACREAFRLSNLFFCSFAVREHGGVNLAAIKLYHIKMGILALICLGSAVVCMVSVLLFSGLFRF